MTACDMSFWLDILAYNLGWLMASSASLWRCRSHISFASFHIHVMILEPLSILGRELHFLTAFYWRGWVSESKLT